MTRNEIFLKKEGTVDGGGAVECQKRSRTDVPASIYPGHAALIELSPDRVSCIRAPFLVEVTCSLSGPGQEP